MNKNLLKDLAWLIIKYLPGLSMYLITIFSVLSYSKLLVLSIGKILLLSIGISFLVEVLLIVIAYIVVETQYKN